MNAILHFLEMSDTQAMTLSLEEEPTQNTTSDVTDNELSADVTDGASSPNQTTASIPTLNSDDE